MNELFVALYEYFRRHRIMLYGSLVLLVVMMGWFASRVKLREDISQFFPDTRNTRMVNDVFRNIRIKDKVILMVSAADKERHETDTERLAEVADSLGARLADRIGPAYIKDVFYRLDGDEITSTADFVYRYLPVFLTEDDFLRIDSLCTSAGVAECMRRNYTHLLSPAGSALLPYFVRDPLGVGTPVLGRLQDLQPSETYRVIDDHIFSKDSTTALLLVTPVFDTGRTGDNDDFVTCLDEELEAFGTQHPDVQVRYYGGPSVAVYNARQIKTDTYLTLGVALIIIIVFIALVFKRKRSILLLLVPVAFGTLFALCLIYWLKGTMSAIALGSGAVVLGIALSYSIHMLAHQNHVRTVPQLIRELAYPMTVGSFTTIGAFFGLLFTSSQLLQDFGLFSALTLVGTTLFCLVYLPHFLSGQADIRQGRVLRVIERINAYHYERNRWLVGGLIVLLAVCAVTSRRVRFNSDMTRLNFETHSMREAAQQLESLSDNDSETVFFVSVGDSDSAAVEACDRMQHILQQLADSGRIDGYTEARSFWVPQAEQQRRLARWHALWTPERCDSLALMVREEARKYGFREGTFDGFFDWLSDDFRMIPPGDVAWQDSRLFAEWSTRTDSLTMLITQVRLAAENKAEVYSRFDTCDGIVVFDRGFFTNRWVEAVNDDFYLVLYISSFLIFLALLVSYGRMELTLISFLPMTVSWIIVLGLMGLLGIEFNIINIILSTFIFGIGDDFSIFIMDGLQRKYRTGDSLLNSHKTAIFFSAFTTVVGMGAMVFAHHPALQSISVMSLLGMVVVVLVAYTFQPILFDIFIAGPARKGLPPYTLVGVLRTAYLFFAFVAGCLLIRLFILLLFLIPVCRSRKSAWVCRSMHVFCRLLLWSAFGVRRRTINPLNEDFQCPAIVVANHQSFIDILVLLALTPRVVMLTNRWVWTSPFFGYIIRYAGFIHTGEGYEDNLDDVRRKVAEGYSVAVFPEGTRTYDGQFKRFHKGAFYMAEALGLDILPLVLHGNGQVIAKAQPFYIHAGILTVSILPRVVPADTGFGATYQARTKLVARAMKEVYAGLCAENRVPANPYYYRRLVSNYIYKGPVEEWYVRIKVAMEQNYELFNRLLPLSGQITNIGCGYGMLDYMLVMMSDGRTVLGIDYDADKVAVARHAWLKRDNIRFEHGDALVFPLPDSDAFVLSDMLHYLSAGQQQKVLERCVARLRPGGMLLIRDGNADDVHRHQLTRLTEWFSTRLLRFNQVSGGLHFVSDDFFDAFARRHRLRYERYCNDRYTSNTIYILRKEQD